MLPPKADVRMEDGTVLQLFPRRDRHEADLYLSRTYEPGTLNLFDHLLRPGDTMVDVGANLGLMTFHASKLVGPSGKVVAVEPHAITIGRLTRHVHINGARNVHIVHCAAGAADERRAIFDVPSINQGRASLIRPDEPHVVSGETWVRPLDDILAEAGAPPPRLIKIDVEGFEAEVLRGAAKTLAAGPMIVMEVTNEVAHEGDPLEAHRMLATAFKCYRFSKSKFDICGLVPLPESTDLTGFHDNLVYVPQGTSLPGIILA